MSIGDVARKVYLPITTPSEPAWVNTIGVLLRSATGATAAACWPAAGPRMAATPLSAIALVTSLDAVSMLLALSFSVTVIFTPSPRKLLLLISSTASCVPFTAPRPA